MQGNFGGIPCSKRNVPLFLCGKCSTLVQMGQRVVVLEEVPVDSGSSIERTVGLSVNSGYYPSKGPTVGLFAGNLA